MAEAAAAEAGAGFAARGAFAAPVEAPAAAAADVAWLEAAAEAVAASDADVAAAEAGAEGCTAPSAADAPASLAPLCSTALAGAAGAG